jgi:proline dehydrogenase
LKVEFCSKCTSSNQRPNSAYEFKQTSSDKNEYVPVTSGVCKACKYVEIKNTIDAANNSFNIPFSVFKLTGLTSFSILKATNNSLEKLSVNQLVEYDNFIKRVNEICSYAAEKNVRIFIDAEDSWFQGSIDRVAELMMNRYNQNEVVVYTTIQFYRWDRLAYLKELHAKGKKENFKIGVKLVRGAYMEKERAMAVKFNYNDPIQKDKLSTDIDFNKGIDYCINNLNELAICLGTHNEKSCLYLVELMNLNKIDNNDSRIYFAQLLGMSDHISFNLSKENYNVAKYVPYGPIKEVMPYLLRRAKENTSVAGQTSRELNLISKESDEFLNT